MQYVIRPTSIGSDMIVEMTTTRKDALTYVAVRWAHTLGLEAFDMIEARDANGNLYLRFTLGTGKTFLVFDIAQLEI
jgi:hypothetical protein